MSAADLLPKLEAHLASLGDGRDCRSDNEKALHYASVNTATRCISALMNLPSDVDRLDAKLAAATAQRDAWLAKQEELTVEIGEFKDWRLAGDARARDGEYERQRVVTAQLKRLHQGTLLSGPGTTFGTLGALEGRVRELTERRDALQLQLAEWTSLAEAVLEAAGITAAVTSS
jgi:hypothetical protein